MPIDQPRNRLRPNHDKLVPFDATDSKVAEQPRKKSRGVTCVPRARLLLLENDMRRPLGFLPLLVASSFNACTQEQADPYGDELRLSDPPGVPLPRDGGSSRDAGSTTDAATMRPQVIGGICDPEDNRWCRASSRWESVACAERWEDVPSQLSCNRVPEGLRGGWRLNEGPACLVASLSWGNWPDAHNETCFYDAQTRKLIASWGQDGCGIYCGGVREVRWGSDPQSNGNPLECGNGKTVTSIDCLPDGTEHPTPPPPPPHPVNDGGPPDGHPAPPRPN